MNNNSNNIDSVRKEFEEKDYTLISTVYKNSKTKLDFICNKHTNLGIQQVSYSSFKKNKHNCSLCDHENRIKTWHSYHKTGVTQEDFRKKHFEQYKQKVLDAVGSEYTLLDIFKNQKRFMLKLKHNDCDSIYTVDQHKFLKGNHRCQNP